MDLNFLFMDDSHSSASRIAALTGLLVPTAGYDRARSEFFRVFEKRIRPEAGIVAQPPTLHGLEFLPDESDEVKVDTYHRLVDLILAEQISIYRIGYYITPGLRAVFADGPHLEGITWLSLLHMLSEPLAQSAIIPVMDGLDQKQTRRFSGPVRQMDIMRAAGLATSISVENAHNLFGEVFYADRKYSAFVQLTECRGNAPYCVGSCPGRKAAF